MPRTEGRSTRHSALGPEYSSSSTGSGRSDAWCGSTCRQHQEERLAELEARRARILDNYVDGLIDKAARDAKIADVAAQIDAVEVRGRIEAVPEIDWSWSPDVLNDVLSALFERIDLDATMRPAEAMWRVPEWRS